jgi:hypothetical protein
MTAAATAHRPCPKCGGVDRFYLVSQPRSGARAYWKCRRCDYWETDDAGPRGVTQDTTPMEPMTPDAYALAHGATWADFERAGCAWIRHRWRGTEYDAIRFPEGNGARLRLFGSSDKWIPESKGMRPVLYGLRRAIKLARESGDPAILLVNGHSSVIALQAAGIPAFTVPGGEGNIAGYLRRDLMGELTDAWDGSVAIMLDGDKQGRKSAPDVLAALVDAGKTAWCVDPGLDMDAADYLRLYGPEAFQPLLDAPPPATANEAPQLDETRPAGRWRLYSYGDLGHLPPTRWLIDRRIVAGGLTLLYGPSGTGKSFRMLDYALQIAEAHPGRAVVYIAPEGGQGYHKRVEAWTAHYGRPIPNNIVWLLDAPRLDDPGQHAELVALLDPLHPICVVIDTLARCAVGLDENSARDMGVLINGCDDLRKQLAERHAFTSPGDAPCGVVLVHHTGKSGTGYRGSSALIAAADMAVELQPDGDNVREECAKAKDDKPFETALLVLHEIPGTESCVMVPASGRVDITAPLTRNERKVLEILNLAVFREAGAKSLQVQEATNLPKPSVFRLLSSLKERGYLTQNSKGDPYFITAHGERVVSNPTPHPDAQVSQLSSKSQQSHETSSPSKSQLSRVSHSFRSETRDSSETRGRGESRDQQSTGYQTVPGFDDWLDDEPLDDPTPTAARALAERLQQRKAGA